MAPNNPLSSPFALGLLYAQSAQAEGELLALQAAACRDPLKRALLAARSNLAFLRSAQIASLHS